MPESWLPIPSGSHFSLSNLPFGIILTASDNIPRPAIAIGDFALDLSIFSKNNGFAALVVIQPHLFVFSEPTLNAFAALGRAMHREVRQYLQEVLTKHTEHPQLLKDNKDLRQLALFPLKTVQSKLPLRIGDYTDFYAGKNHAYNCGVLFRGPSNALQPNYTHLPVGYHGRASSIVVSGTPIRRPSGQILENPSAEIKKPILAASRRLDIELEIGAFICKANEMGQPVPITTAEDNLFGFVLMNDWSARDIQAWENIPLGPFNSKNFGTSISAWVVLADALEPFRTTGMETETKLLPYLCERREDAFYDIDLEVVIKTANGNSTTITETNARNLLFSFPQMIAHHTITGCPMQVGDLLGSGTISGTVVGSEGSMLEKSQGGKSSLHLNGGEERTFLEDGDTITIRGWAVGEKHDLVGFGECTGSIESAIVP